MQDQTKLLAIHNKPVKLREFKKALDKQGISVDLRKQFGLPSNLHAMTEYDAIMLADTEAKHLNSRQMDNRKKICN